MLNTYKTLLTLKTQLNSNTYLYHFNLLEPKEIIFKPGQYVMLKVPSDKGPVSRLYSIASSVAEKNSFQLIIEIIPSGLASKYFSGLKLKDEVVFQGPAGMFSLKENNKTKVFMVTGTGIAPARSMIISNIKDQIPALPAGRSKQQIKNQKYHLFWGLKNYQDVYILDELKQLSNETMKQFEFKICLSREQNLDMVVSEEDKKYFTLGHVDLCFNNEIMKQLNNYDYYLCGGRLIVESLKQFLLSKNVSLENIIFEKF